MYTFRIWAPKAKKLAVQVGEQRLLMQGPDAHGWWWAGLESAEAGSDYGFLVDDDPKVYPDPRSLWQPRGVHGMSRVYDQDAFSWSDTGSQAAPLSSAIVYELHVGTFTPEGTLDAAGSKLDYLKELGITHVELMPVASFSGNHGWGYDGVALFAVHEPYGGPDALKRFVDAAHRRELAVLLDVVYNHFGPVGNYTGKFGAYVTETHQTPWGGAVNLEGADAYEVRRFFCDNAQMWMRDFHIDGLRLDAVHAFVDRSAIHFLEQLAMETKALEATLGRRLVLIAESDLNDPRIVTARDAGGFGLDAQWSDDFHHALFAVLAREPESGYYADFGRVGQLAKALQDTFVYDGIYSEYRKCVHGRPAKHLPQSRFLGYIQNHDQVGNRATGERLTESVGFNRAKIAAAMILLSPFVPMLFQGEEWAASSPFPYFADHDDPELARLVSEGRKKEFAVFGWDPALIPDPEKRDTFENAKLHWDEIQQERHAEMLRWYRNLIYLRRTTADLNNSEPGQTSVAWDEDERWIAMERGSITLICNLGNAEYAYPLPDGANIILGSRPNLVPNNSSLKLPPNTAAVLSS
ncbi:malto-oligosyltrehalose trehalohydrolase [Acidicapsa dinghuensis]|uniref:Malto-oligosyltrehalose trehalohydrolase n=1 Tax=Acidicapsa dinghuensis TaxID=2218256 RepID=A0ABW1EGM5_9BACT|nr:malto-oligosyltrehalose trehalohydrolase [Acidicapsa dinghuensis]